MARGRHGSSAAAPLRAAALLACVAACAASSAYSSFDVGGSKYYCQAQAYQARFRRGALNSARAAVAARQRVAAAAA